MVSLMFCMVEKPLIFWDINGGQPSLGARAKAKVSTNRR